MLILITPWLKFGFEGEEWGRGSWCSKCLSTGKFCEKKKLELELFDGRWLVRHQKAWLGRPRATRGREAIARQGGTGGDWVEWARLAMVWLASMLMGIWYEPAGAPAGLLQQIVARPNPFKEGSSRVESLVVGFRPVDFHLRIFRLYFRLKILSFSHILDPALSYLKACLSNTGHPSWWHHAIYGVWHIYDGQTFMASNMVVNSKSGQPFYSRNDKSSYPF